MSNEFDIFKEQLGVLDGIDKELKQSKSVNIPSEEIEIERLSENTSEYNERIGELEKEGKRLKELEEDSGFKEYFDASIQRFSPIVKGVEKMAYNVGERMEMYERTGEFKSLDDVALTNKEFIDKKGWESIIKEPYYEGIEKNFINESIETSGHNEEAFRRKMDRMVQFKEADELYNNESGISQFAMGTAGFLTDPLNAFVMLKTFDYSNKLFKVVQGSTLSKKVGIGVLTGSAEGAISTAYVDGLSEFTSRDELKENLMINTLIGGIAGGILNKFEVSSLTGKSKATADFSDFTFTETPKDLNNLKNEVDNLIKTESKEVEYIKPNKDEKGVTDITPLSDYETANSSTFWRGNQDYIKYSNDAKKAGSITGSSLNNYLFKDSIGFSKKADGTAIGQGEVFGVEIIRKQEVGETKISIARKSLYKELEEIDYFKEVPKGKLEEDLYIKMTQLQDGKIQMSDLPKPIQKYLKNDIARRNEHILKYKKEHGIEINKVNDDNYYAPVKYNRNLIAQGWQKYDKKLYKVFNNAVKSVSKMEVNEFTSQTRIDKIHDEIAKSIVDRSLLSSNKKVEVDYSLMNNIEEITNDLLERGIVTKKEVDNLFKKSQENVTPKQGVIQDSVEVTNKGEKKAVKPNFGRNRVDMDTLLETKIDGEMISVSDFLDKNFTDNILSQERQIQSDLVTREKGKIKIGNDVYDLINPGDVNKLRTKMLKEGMNKNVVEDMLENIENVKAGFVTEKKSGSGFINSAATSARSFTNFYMLAGSIFSTAPEIGKAVQRSLHKNVLKDFGDTSRIFKDAVEGKLSKEQTVTMDDFGYLYGREKFNNTKSLIIEEDINISTDSQLLETIQNSTRKAENFSINVLSQMGNVASKSRMMIASGTIREFVERASKGKLLSETRRAELSITKQEELDIHEFINKSGDIKGKRIDEIMYSFEKSGFRKNPLYKKFLDGVHENVDNRILKRYVGEGMKVVEQEWYGRIAFSLINYPLNAYRRVALKNIAHKDLESVNILLNEYAFSLVGYTAASFFRSKDTEDFKKRMSPEKLLIGVTGNTSIGGVPSMALATSLGIFGVGEDYGIRNRKIDDGLSANPVVQTLTNVVGGTLALPGKIIDDDVEVKDIQKMLPYLLGLKFLLGKLEE